MIEVELGELIAALGGELTGNPALKVTHLGPLESADQATLSFLANPRYQAQLQTTRAGCVIVSPAMADAASARGAAIVTPDPYLYFARCTQWWAKALRPAATARIHPSAVIDTSAEIGAGVDIGALVVIEADARIGAGASIGAHSVVGPRAQVGEGSRLSARVTVAYDCVIGRRCIVHSGVVIGADGFGFARVQGPEAAAPRQPPPEGVDEASGGRALPPYRWEKIEQLGAVRIGDDVEIGANTCIDRGALSDTVIEDGVKLDNLIQIGHNVRVGAHSALAGCVGVAGSADIGAHCTVGGGAIILGHLTVADHVNISAATVVTRSIAKAGTYSGVFPFDDNASWEKNAATLRQLHSMRDRLRALERTIQTKNDS